MIARSLTRQVVGIYFDGSIALGDFDPARSDIDLVAVTHDPLSDSAAKEISAIHVTFARSSPAWGQETEVIYVSQRELSGQAVESRHIHRYVERGTGGLLQTGPLDLGWLVHLRVLSRQGITITGSDIRELVVPVSDEALRRVVVFGAENWLRPYCVDPSSLQRPGTRAFAILTACRMLHTFRTGAVVSKIEAAETTLRRVDFGHSNAIHAAIRWRKHDPDLAASPEEAVRLLEFVRAHVSTVR